MFNNPRGIAVDEGTGDVYVADSCNHVIRKISSKGYFYIYYCMYFSLNLI